LHPSVFNFIERNAKRKKDHNKKHGKTDAAGDSKRKVWRRQETVTYREELAHVVADAGPAAAARDLGDQPPAAEWARDQGKWGIVMGANMGGRR
jgi:hypothetical protein